MLDSIPDCSRYNIVSSFNNKSSPSVLRSALEFCVCCKNNTSNTIIFIIITNNSSYGLFTTPVPPPQYHALKREQFETVTIELIVFPVISFLIHSQSNCFLNSIVLQQNLQCYKNPLLTVTIPLKVGWFLPIKEIHLIIYSEGGVSKISPNWAIKLNQRFYSYSL